MSLARTALRLIVSAALKGDSGARPTIAAERVYDSRISEFAPDAFAGDAKPTIIILTDVDEGAELSAQNGGPPFRRVIEVVLELGMIQSVKDGADYVVGYPDTDARHEASLDLLEFQVIRRLAYDPAPLAVLFRRIARIRKSECHRQVADDSGVKIAARILTLHCEVSDDQVKVYTAGVDQMPAGLDVLPDPLRTVAKAMPDGSHGANIAAALAAAITNMTTEALEGVDVEIINGNDAPGVEAPIDLPDQS